MDIELADIEAVVEQYKQKTLHNYELAIVDKLIDGLELEFCEAQEPCYQLVVKVGLDRYEPYEKEAIETSGADLRGLARQQMLDKLHWAIASVPSCYGVGMYRSAEDGEA